MSRDLQEAIVGFGLPTRCAASVASDDNPLFLVASCSVKDDNEIYLVQYDPISNAAAIKKVFAHGKEIRQMSTLHTDPSFVFTSTPEKPGFPSVTAMYNLLDNAPTSRMGEISLKYTFPLKHLAKIIQAPHDPKLLGILTKEGLSLWTDLGSEWKLSTSTPSPYNWTKCGDNLTMSWDPLHLEYVATGSGKSIVITDIRTGSRAMEITTAHLGDVKCVDYAPTTQYRLASGSKDGSVALWDTRNASKEIMSFDAHSHWVESLSFNPFHDELLLTTSTDKAVKIWNVGASTGGLTTSLSSSSVTSSSTLFGSLSSTRSERITPVEESFRHEDTVYSSCWCISDAHPWHYITVSQLGLAAIGTVTNKTQYSILLRGSSF